MGRCPRPQRKLPASYGSRSLLPCGRESGAQSIGSWGPSKFESKSLTHPSLVCLVVLPPGVSPDEQDTSTSWAQVLLQGNPPEGEVHTPHHPSPARLPFARPSLEKRKVSPKPSLWHARWAGAAPERGKSSPPLHSHPKRSLGAQSSPEE